tara:strand:- start:431 stop:1114 length:684 start_codon:yes stop_codon:yes gene_type:complete
MNLKYNYILIGVIVFVCIGCKDARKIELESSIDQFEYLIKQPKIKDNELQQLKTQFENLSYSKKYEIEISSLYYLSEISLIENKLDEAYNFIYKAYHMNYADSIYKQLKKIEGLLKPKIDTIAVVHESGQEKALNNIIEIGRQEIKVLYENKKYDEAINQTNVLISMIKSLKKEEDINIELSQLYQDLAIFYAQKNNLVEAKKYINKAIQLNPNAENKEIQSLINKK